MQLKLLFKSTEVADLGKKHLGDADNQKLARKGSGGSSSRGHSPVNDSRRCTDALFLLLLVACWAAMTGIGLAATGVIESAHIKKGDPRRLVHGMDYHGNLCGVTNHLTPAGDDVIDLPKAYPLPSGLAVCVAVCPRETDYDAFVCEYEVQHEIDELFDASHVGLMEEEAHQARRSLYLFYVSRKQCMPRIESMSFLGYCIPTLSLDAVTLTDAGAPENTTDTKSTGLRNVTGTNSSGTTSMDVSVSIARRMKSRGGDFFDEAMADVTTVRYVIFAFGCGMALALGFAFLVVIQLPGFLSLLVWSMIFAVDAGLFAMGYYSKITSARWAANGARTENEATALFYAGYVLYGLAALFLLVVLGLRKKIVLAIACVREAAKAIASMPVITLFPVIQVLGLVAFTSVWGIFMAFLGSSGEVVPSCFCPANVTVSTLVETAEDDAGVCGDGCVVHKDLVFSANTKYAGFYMLFAWFWTSQFIVAVGQVIVALATSLWYFKRDINLIKNATFFRAVCLVLRYHLGTAAFGSLIIAIVKTIRAILTYIQKKATKSKLRVAVVILSVLKCLLWCVEKCLKFINKQVRSLFCVTRCFILLYSNE